MKVLLVFLCSFINNFISTREIACISQALPARASLWAGLSSSLYLLITIVIVLDVNRWNLILPYVLGDMLGTWIALRKR